MAKQKNPLQDVEPKEPEVEVQPQIEEPKKEMVVDLSPKKEEERKSINPEEIDKLHKRMEFQARQFEKSQRELRDAVQAIQSLVSSQQGRVPDPVQSKEQPSDELDRIAEQDWKKAVKILGREAALEIFQEALQQHEVQQQQISQQSILEQSKRKVLERYPMIEDETSDEARLFLEAIEEDPNVKRDPYGPVVAMLRMEEKMAQMGRTPSSVKPQVEREVDRERQRLARVQATSSTQGRQPSQDGKVVLTDDEVELCRERGISIERFAEMKKRGQGAFKEGVSVS